MQTPMRIERDVPITMDDGVVLRADLFIPIEEGEYPTLLSYGPYGKGLAFQEGYKPQWDYMIEKYPEVAEDTSNEHQNWEVVDPERWVPAGYVCARVDSRGTGRSPGYVDVWSGRETVDLYDCIEWAASQPWSNGRIGLAGISYYAMNQYQVAALQPPHLAAICPWEGASDWYRDFARHGGILCEFAQDWYPRQVENVQHGVGERGFFSAVTGESVSGPDTEAPEVLASRRADLGQDVKSRPLIDAWHLERNPDWSRVRTPMLSAANWGGQGLHLRGNIEAFTQVGSHRQVAGSPWRCALGRLLHGPGSRPATPILRSLPEGRGQRLGFGAQGPDSASDTSTAPSPIEPRTSGPSLGPPGPAIT